MTMITEKYKITTVTVSIFFKKTEVKSDINSCYCVSGWKFLSRNLFACLQEVIGSLLLLSEAKSSLQLIKYFSHRHTL